MWEMDGNLTLSVRILSGFLFLVLFLGDDASDPELSRHPEGYRADDCSRAKVSKLIAVVSHTLCSAIIAVDESRIGFPGVWRLVFELFTVWIMVSDSFFDLYIDRSFNDGRNSAHVGSELPDILERLEK
jgi:hypothetical protein